MYEAFLPVTSADRSRPADAGQIERGDRSAFAYWTNLRGIQRELVQNLNVAQEEEEEAEGSDLEESDLEEEEMAFQPITFAPRVVQDAHAHTHTHDTIAPPIHPRFDSSEPRFDSINPNFDDPSSPTSPHPLDPTLIQPSPMAVGGEDYARYFADYERLLTLQARAFEAVDATRAPGGPGNSANGVPANAASVNEHSAPANGNGVGTGRPPPLALSLSIPSAPVPDAATAADRKSVV